MCIRDSLTLVDPALRHLPRLKTVIDALADEHLAVAVEEHDARAGAIGQGFGVDGLHVRVLSVLQSCFRGSGFRGQMSIGCLLYTSRCV